MENYKNENWISIRSATDQPIIIYANRPLDTKEELDIKPRIRYFFF
jgi:hypothetical protein